METKIKTTIHRSGRRGSSCAALELAAGNSRLIVDTGWPWLDDDWQAIENARLGIRVLAVRPYEFQSLVTTGSLPDVRGLYPWEASPNVDAVLLARPQLDCAGLRHFVRPEVPFYAAPEVIDRVAEGTRCNLPTHNRALTFALEEGVPRRIGAFEVLPVRFPRSVVGALALIVRTETEELVVVGETVRGALEPAEIQALADRLTRTTKLYYIGWGRDQQDSGLTVADVRARLERTLQTTAGLVHVLVPRGEGALWEALGAATAATGRTLIVEPKTWDLHPTALQGQPSAAIAWATRPGAQRVGPGEVVKRPADFAVALAGHPWDAAEPVRAVPQVLISLFPPAYLTDRMLAEVITDAETRGSSVERWALARGHGTAYRLTEHFPQAGHTYLVPRWAGLY